jgi:hypothetical protein
MCALQPISYVLLIAFCNRHRPPPDRKGARPPDHGAGICVRRTRAARRAFPVAVRSAYTPVADVPAGVSPPSTMSSPGESGATSSRLSGAGRCYGSKPDSAASRTGGAAAARTRGGAVPCVLVPPCGRIANHVTTATTTMATVATTARLRRTRAAARGRWRGVLSKGSGPDGRRRRYKGSGRTKQDVIEVLKKSEELDAGLSTSRPTRSRGLPVTGLSTGCLGGITPRTCRETDCR